MSVAKIVATVAAAAFTLSGCAGTPATEGEEQTGTNRPAATTTSAAAEPAPEPTPTEEPEPAPEETEDEEKVLAFGATATFEDGLSVKVSKPVKFTPSQSAAKDPAKAYVKFTITVVNKTGKAYDPGLLYATVQSANVEAGTVYDSERGLEGGPSTKVLNGRETKFDLGFGVANPNDIVMELNPGGFDYNSVLYTNAP